MIYNGNRVGERLKSGFILRGIKKELEGISSNSFYEWSILNYVDLSSRFLKIISSSACLNSTSKGQKLIQSNRGLSVRKKRRIKSFSIALTVFRTSA
jgi:hypothetical protein